MYLCLFLTTTKYLGLLLSPSDYLWLPRSISVPFRFPRYIGLTLSPSNYRKLLLSLSFSLRLSLTFSISFRLSWVLPNSRSFSIALSVRIHWAVLSSNWDCKQSNLQFGEREWFRYMPYSIQTHKVDFGVPFILCSLSPSSSLYFCFIFNPFHYCEVFFFFHFARTSDQ